MMLISTTVFSYNSEVCTDLYSIEYKEWQLGTAEALVLNPIISSTHATTYPTSVSQFSFSDGSCAGNSASEKEKINFFKNNYMPLRVEISKGEGEYLETFADLFKCNIVGRLKFKEALRKDYEKIFPEKSENLIKTGYKELSDSAWYSAGKECMNSVNSSGNLRL